MRTLHGNPGGRSCSTRVSAGIPPAEASVPTRKKRLLCLVNLVSFFVHGIYTTM